MIDNKLHEYPGFSLFYSSVGVLFFLFEISREPHWQQSPEWWSCMWTIVRFSSNVVHVNPKFGDLIKFKKWRDFFKDIILTWESKESLQNIPFCNLELQIT